MVHLLSDAHKPLFDILLIIVLGCLYPLLHTANSWLFSFAEISPNIGLIYLPAFLRLLNVLVLGKFKGTLAGLLGGFILVPLQSHEPTWLEIVNTFCSTASPVVAVLLFEHWRQRSVQLVSLHDLGLVTLICCISNALLHHFAWALLAPDHLGSSSQLLWMVLGDFVGTLIGAYALKWAASRMDQPPPPSA